mmetsp:Transcript_24138/g.26804  ORF Transcript_24138/g.26804 Transcript_24138/m.26804 type:complete len:310 (-) Transcript_24138:171-1100(-)
MACCFQLGGPSGKSEGELAKDRKKSRMIDQDLRNRDGTPGRQHKLLLLGTGDSGKSTFAKQMKILFLNGFKKREIEAYRLLAKEQVMQTIIRLAQGAEKLGIKVGKKKDIESINEATELNMENVKHVEAVWADKGIKEAWAKRREFQIDTCADYLLDNVRRIASEDFQPTEKDILRLRKKSTGIIEIKFEIEDSQFCLVDVGGQRSERRKWLHCFEDVSAIVYFVALNEYDMKLEEDERVNRMRESLELFLEISSSKWFNKTPFIMFLNKSDLFREKVKEVPLTDLFPEYKGGKNYEEGLSYIKKTIQG